MKSVDETTDPENDLSEIVSCIMFCVEKCAPIKIFKKRRQQTWVTNRVKNLNSQREMGRRTKHYKQKSTQECKK